LPNAFLPPPPEVCFLKLPLLRLSANLFSCC
jgi:hypothetical protein